MFFRIQKRNLLSLLICMILLSLFVTIASRQSLGASLPRANEVTQEVNYEFLCSKTRKKYSLIAEELQKNGEKGNININTWKLGDGVDLVTKGCLTFHDRFYKYYDTE
jgi:hypothetical protein